MGHKAPNNTPATRSTGIQLPLCTIIFHSEVRCSVPTETQRSMDLHKVCPWNFAAHSLPYGNRKLQVHRRFYWLSRSTLEKGKWGKFYFNCMLVEPMTAHGASFFLQCWRVDLSSQHVLTVCIRSNHPRFCLHHLWLSSHRGSTVESSCSVKYYTFNATNVTTTLNTQTSSTLNYLITCFLQLISQQLITWFPSVNWARQLILHRLSHSVVMYVSCSGMQFMRRAGYVAHADGGPFVTWLAELWYGQRIRRRKK